MIISILDAKTLGDDLDFSLFGDFGTLKIYDTTPEEKIAERINHSDCVIINKVKLCESNLKNADKLKIICLAATGYDNVDTEYCHKKGIAVCNVVGYSTYSVAQTCAALVLSLSMHIMEYHGFVADGSYTKSGVQNKISPVFYEIKDKTWGILGLGNIGKQTAAIASALGAKVICCKRSPEEGYNCVDFETLCRQSDIITVHLPHTAQTNKIIDKKAIDMMKDGVMLVNVARGKVLDEEEVTKAVENGKISAFGTDVFSTEPLQSDSPYNRILKNKNVCFTPHMAWAAYEARKRLMEEIHCNISSFLKGEMRNRVDIKQ